MIEQIVRCEMCGKVIGRTYLLGEKHEFISYQKIAHQVKIKEMGSCMGTKEECQTYSFQGEVCSECYLHTSKAMGNLLEVIGRRKRKKQDEIYVKIAETGEILDIKDIREHPDMKLKVARAALLGKTEIE